MPLHHLTARPLIGALTTLAALAALPTAADAATVLRDGSEVKLTGAPGEANVVTASLSGGNLVITDSGATALVDGDGAAGCSVAGRTATCPARGLTGLRLAGGDGDDQLSGAPEIRLVADGGDGRDVLFGTPQADGLIGGAGDDALRGGAGDDQLQGSLGDDDLHGGVGADRFTGGLGLDTASYAGATEPKTADLDGVVGDDGSAEDGAAGARDTLAGDVEHLVGGAGADVLTGSTAANRILGGPGGDQLRGRVGNDHLDGEAGGDTLYGSTGGDVLQGGDGTDRVRYDESTQDKYVTIGNGVADDGSDEDGPRGARDDVRADVENVAGGTGNDWLIGTDGRNVLSGEEGNDELEGGAGTDELIGGPGGGDIAAYRSSTQPESLSLDGLPNDGSADDGPPDARDRLRDIEGLVGGAAQDSLTGDDAPNILYGGHGGDVLEGRGGYDVEYGGEGRDVFFEGATANSGDHLDGEGGDDDLIHYISRTSPVFVDLSGVALSGEDANRDGVSEEGDRLKDIEDAYGGLGPDRIEGSAGPNTLFGNDGNDRLSAGEGDDRLLSGWDDDVVMAGPGNDTIDSGYGADDQYGGDGDDTFTSTSCAVVCGSFTDRGDQIRGEGGTDTIDFTGRQVGVRVDIGGYDQGEDADFNGDSEEDDRIETIERVLGTNQRDWIRTSVTDDRIEGRGGDDVLDGGNGADTVLGGEGNDRVDGGIHADTSSGGPGDDLLFQSFYAEGPDDLRGDEGYDTVSYSGRSAKTSISIDDAANDGEIGEGDNVHTDVERLEGGSGEDWLYGSAAANRLEGNSGTDFLYGQGGDDVLLGGPALDVLAGGPDQDRIEGGIGDDRLHGEEGNDELLAGDGQDALTGGPGNDAVYGEAGDDVFWEGNVANGADVISCGTGGESPGDHPWSDTVSYHAPSNIHDGRTVSLAISFDGVANDGEDPNGDKVAEEGDNVMPDCEELWGGSAGDFFDSHGGAQTIIGMAGNDGFRSNGGADRFEGRDGDDVFLVRDGQKQVVNGGAGSGDVAQADVGLDTLIDVP